MRRLILGGDPGLSGALALICAESGDAVEVIDMPTRPLLPRRQRKGPPRRDKKGRAIPLKQDSRRVLDIKTMRDWLTPHLPGIHLAVVEFVSSRTGQGPKSIFTLGGSFWGLQACLECCGINHLAVAPRTWQQHYGLAFKASQDKDERKRLIAERCKDFYPAQWLYGPRNGLRDGRSDALMIARYVFETGARAKLLGDPPFGSPWLRS